MQRGKDVGLILCLKCHCVTSEKKNNSRCIFCHSVIRMRKDLGNQGVLALILFAVLLYVPANIFPLITTQQFGQNESSTVLSGIITLATEGMIYIAMLVFLFSIVIPIFKITGLFILLIVAKNKQEKPLPYVKLYQFLKFIGRWSMLDIFVIVILKQLIQFGFFGSVNIQLGTFAFSMLVIITMIANMMFDPRTLYD